MYFIKMSILKEFWFVEYKYYKDLGLLGFRFFFWVMFVVKWYKINGYIFRLCGLMF